MSTSGRPTEPAEKLVVTVGLDTAYSMQKPKFDVEMVDINLLGAIEEQRDLALVPALIEQLRPGGRMAIPVGKPYGLQELRLVEKDADGRVTSHDVLGVAFVPLIDRPPAAE